MAEYDNLPRVAHIIDQFTVVANYGTEAGATPGQRILIFGLGGEILDPVSNNSLGRLEVVKGRGKVTHVQEKICTIESAELAEIDSGRKVIKRSGTLSFALGEREEIIQEPRTERKPFREPEVGDYIRRI